MSVHGEEMWQAYSEQGESTVPITRKQAGDGVLHGASHVWIWRQGTDDIEVLVQQRAHDKLTWPGYFDISAAGHIDAGETPLAAAIRETSEEIGLEVEPISLDLIGVHRAYLETETTAGKIIENEFQWVYLLHSPHDSASFVLGDGEVGLVRWVDMETFRAMVEGVQGEEQLVPHGYFQLLLSHLADREEN